MMTGGKAAGVSPSGGLRGDEGNRTPNPCLAKAVLCQLSYVPGCAGCARAQAGGSPRQLGSAEVQAFLAPAAGAVASRHRSSCALADLLRRITKRTPPATAASARSFFTSISSFGKAKDLLRPRPLLILASGSTSLPQVWVVGTEPSGTIPGLPTPGNEFGRPLFAGVVRLPWA